jgi:hypothetical protein
LVSTSNTTRRRGALCSQQRRFGQRSLLRRDDVKVKVSSHVGQLDCHTANGVIVSSARMCGLTTTRR